MDGKIRKKSDAVRILEIRADQLRAAGDLKSLEDHLYLISVFTDDRFALQAAKIKNQAKRSSIN